MVSGDTLWAIAEKFYGDGNKYQTIADAIGVDAFRRAPVSADIVLMSLTHGRRTHEPLQSHL